MLGLLGLGRLQFLAIGAAAALIGGLLLWNNTLRTDLRTSKDNNATLQVAVEQQGETVEAALVNAQEWQETLQELQKTHEELQGVEKRASAETRRLQRIFTKHDFTALTLAKPGLIENRINRGTVSAISVLNRLTTKDIQPTTGVGSTSGTAVGAEP